MEVEDSVLKNYNYDPMGKGVKMGGGGGELFSSSFPALFPSYHN
jgi:hypothetical protein